MQILPVPGRPRMVAMVLAIGMVALYLGLWSDIWAPHTDSSVYLCLARSLAGGEGFAIGGEPHYRFPPLFPFMLAGVMSVAGIDWALLHLVPILSALAALVLAYVVMRRFLEPGGALLICALVGLNPYTVKHAHMLLTEMPYTLWSLAAVAAGQRLLTARRRRGTWVAATAAAIAIAALIRPIGVTLGLGLAWRLVRGKEAEESWRARLGKLAAVGVLAGAPFLAWCLHSFGPKARGTDYLEVLALPAPAKVIERPALAARYVDRLVENGLGRPIRMLEVMVGLPEIDACRGLAALALLATVGLGWWLSVRRRPDVAHAYVGFYVLVYAWWPASDFARFFVPILPLLLYYAAVGVRFWVDRVAAALGSGRPDGVAASIAAALWGATTAYLALKAGVAVAAPVAVGTALPALALVRPGLVTRLTGWRGGGARQVLRAGLVAFCLVAVASSWFGVRDFARTRASEPVSGRWAAMRDLATCLSRHERGPIACYLDADIHWLVDWPVTDCLVTRDDYRKMRQLATSGARYYLVETWHPLFGSLGAPLPRRWPDCFTPIYENAMYRLYRFNPTKDAMALASP